MTQSQQDAGPVFPFERHQEAALVKRSPGWVARLGCSAVGAVLCLLCAAAVLAPLSQYLIDSDDDDVVLATILYFKWAAGACLLASGTLGALAGWVLTRPPRPLRLPEAAGQAATDERFAARKETTGDIQVFPGPKDECAYFARATGYRSGPG